MTNAKDTRIRPGNVDSSMETTIKKMKNEMSASTTANDYEAKLQRVKNTKTLKENIEKLLEFTAECEQNGHKKSSRYSQLVYLHCLCQFAGPKPFKAFTKADIIEFLNAARYRRFEDRRRSAKANPANVEKELAISTMNLVKFHVKRFFQWLFECEKGQYPENVRWIKLQTIKGERELTPEELPMPQEVKAMIECTENPRNRALISLLAESGARAGEISMVRLKDISWNENGFILTIHAAMSKSKYGRRIPLCACAEDIKRWINDFHAFKNDPQAPLFTTFSNSKMLKSNLKVAGIGGIVRRVAIRSGVEKRIHMHTHKFRHSRASQLAELGWNEMMLRQFFGWSKISTMPATYIHMSQKSMNNRYYRMYGKADPEKSKEQNLEEPNACSNCGVRNPSGYRFCFRCNAALDSQEQKLIENERQVKNTLNLIAKSPELAEKFSQLLQEAMLKEGLQQT